MNCGHGDFLFAASEITTGDLMNESNSAKKLSGMVGPFGDAATAATAPDIPAIAVAQFWLLEAGTAKKLGLRSTGSLSYQVLADRDRRNLFIALTQNDGGGYFSKERVNMVSIEACLAAHKTGAPFPSKALKDAYQSRSSNNAGFLSATLRVLGLAAAAPNADTKHIVAGDWDAWRKKMIAVTGTLIELPGDADEKQAQSGPFPAQKEHRKTLEIAAKKLQ
jgi:hypothetical protein